MATKASVDLSVFGKGQHETIKLNEIKKKIKKKNREMRKRNHGQNTLVSD